MWHRTDQIERGYIDMLPSSSVQTLPELDLVTLELSEKLRRFR
jgi:hypothetical protein